MNRIQNLFLLLRAQMWIVPVFVCLLALGLAYYLLHYGDDLLSVRERDTWWIFSGDAGSARGLLSSMLSGLITMTSLVVSITFVIIALAANQLGPRLITTFTGDRQIQLVFGLFIGTIFYLLLVLRTVDETLGDEGVPHVAVTTGSALTILCLFTLVFYLHKIARSIIADNVVTSVADELVQHVRDILPERNAADEGDVPIVSDGHTLSLGRRGYIQTIDYDALVEWAVKYQVVLKVDVRAGHFLMKCATPLQACSPTALGPDAVRALRNAFVIGQQRTPSQDLEHGIRHLVEIAIRALSPSVNDAFTAIAVLDRLGGAFEDVLSRSLPPTVLRDDRGVVRVIADRSTITGLFDAAFDQIRQAAKGHPAVLIRIADVLGQLAPALVDAESRRAVMTQLSKLTDTTGQSALSRADQDDVLRRIGDARAAVEHTRAKEWTNAVPLPPDDPPPSKNQLGGST